MRRKVTAVVFSLGCLQASSALALGLGEFKLESFLNEPLQASVDLLNTGGLHEDEIRIRLGTREDFKRLGLDRSFFLTSIEFDVVIDADGTAHIELSTDEPVLEPYLDFIVEARWPSGRLLREYTVLVDPPTYSDATPVVSASQRVEEVEGIPAPTKKKSEVVANTGTRVDVRKSTLGPGEMPQRNFNAAASTAPSSGDRYMIKRDDTLWSIAERARPEGTSVHQTMLDIQRLNPDAFINNNINRVKAGYIIYLPNSGDISSADYEAALREVQEQNAAWREGRDAELAASRPSLRIAADDEEEAALQEAAAGGSDALAAAEAAERAAAELESAAEAEIDAGDGAGRADAIEERLVTLERIVDIKDEQIAALQAALAEAQAANASGEAPTAGDEVMSEDASALLGEGDDATAYDEQYDDEYAVVDAEGESQAVDVEDDMEADPGMTETDPEADAAEDEASAPVVEKEDTKPAVVVQPAPAEPAGGGIMDYLWYIVGAVVLGLLGLFVARRRRSEEDEDDYDDDSTSEDVFSDVELREQNLDIAEEPLDIPPVAAAAAAGEQTRGYGERKHDAYASDVDAGDALAEADIYIAYGRHHQAIDLLNNALASEPNNPVYRLKLMEIHTELNDRSEVSEQLHQLRSIGDTDAVARGEELLASFEAASGAPAATPAQQIPDVATSPDDGPGLTPNPLDTSRDAPVDDEADFAGLEIEEDEAVLGDEDDLDLSEDFARDDADDDDDEDILIAADANGMSTKLDLARAYMDMGDDDGARQILEEVIAEGNDALKSEAQALLDRLG
ncbi:MAG: hypothetical protein Hals2KO_03460 [Halioglobus sp.]